MSNGQGGGPEDERNKRRGGLGVCMVEGQKMRGSLIAIRPPRIRGWAVNNINLCWCHQLLLRSGWMVWHGILMNPEFRLLLLLLRLRLGLLKLLLLCGTGCCGLACFLLSLVSSINLCIWTQSVLCPSCRSYTKSHN